MSNFVTNVWQSIKDYFHRLNQRMENNHEKRRASDRKQYLKDVTKESIEMFNFVEYKGKHFGTLNDVVITLEEDTATLLDRIGGLRKKYVESKMEEYDNGENA